MLMRIGRGSGLSLFVSHETSLAAITIRLFVSLVLLAGCSASVGPGSTLGKRISTVASLQARLEQLKDMLA